MNWHREIDNYCERTGPEFWAEPLNAVTNGAFLIAAAVGLILAIRQGRLDGPVTYLIVLVSAIGIGSFLFHTYATVWAAIADTTPIGLFILSYFAIAMNRYVGFGWGISVALAIVFLVAMAAVAAGLRPLVHDHLNGSQSYIPAFLGLMGVGAWLSARAHPAGLWLIGAGVVFAVSITFRSLDFHLCHDLASGTHWPWHILNAVVLGTLIVALIRHGRRDTLEEARSVF